MSVDVSPRGDELVFDLLGDLYTLPMAGGATEPAGPDPTMAMPVFRPRC